jgi:zinc transport system ATP-binding protein
MMAKNLLLEVENLSVSLSEEKVLEDLSFELERKEILVILGPNGAGKTVLLRTLLGLVPFEGQISWEKGTKIGYVPEGLTAPQNLPLNVSEFFGFKNYFPKDVFQALSWVGMKNFSLSEKRLDALSFGQFKRILIAWALIDNPRVLLLDEPLIGLDIHGRETIYDSLVKLWQEKKQSVILVSHEIGEVCKKADKILALNKKILFYGPPEKVVTSKNLAKIYGHSVSL